MTAKLPRIKVCGVTRAADLEVLAAVGVDAVGLNLVPTSPRYLARARLHTLGARARELKLTCVAVVMDPDASELQQLIDLQIFDFIQLHGTESPELIADLNAPPNHKPGIIKAISWSDRSEEVALATAWNRLRLQPSDGALQLEAFLVDAYAPGQGGGTGRVARWDLLSPHPEVLKDTPLILAGGLTPDNVVSAIRATRPAGVDTASGVEIEPGIKSPDLVRAFASNAARALQELEA